MKPKYLLFISIVLLPFYNDFPLIAESHFFRTPSNVILLLLSFLALKHINGKLSYNISKNATYLLCIIIISFISNLLNNNIISITSFIKSILNLIIYLLAAIKISKINFKLDDLRKAVNIGFYIMCIYGSIEILGRIYALDPFVSLLSNLEMIFHDRVYLQGKRVRGLAFEPSYLSLVIAFIWPFIITENVNRVKKFAKIIILIAIVHYTHSRTLYAIFFIQILAFIYINYKDQILKLITKKIYIPIIMSLLGFVFINFIIESVFSLESHNVSNVVRISSLIASVQLALDNLLVGVGLGQSGFYIREYYPDFFFSTYESTIWADSDSFESGSPTFSLLPDIFSEIGVFGLLFFIKLFYDPMKRIIKQKATSMNSIIIFVIVVGLFVGSFGVDNFTFPGYWIALGISYSLIK